jgi:hypothetical protein
MNPASSRCHDLLQEFQYKLLLLVRLGQRGNAGLFQDGVLSESRDRRWNVGRADAVFGTGQVLNLVGDDAGGALQAVDGCADRASQRSHRLNGCVDARQGGRGVGDVGEVIDRPRRPTGKASTGKRI